MRFLIASLSSIALAAMALFIMFGPKAFDVSSLLYTPIQSNDAVHARMEKNTATTSAVVNGKQFALKNLSEKQKSFEGSLTLPGQWAVTLGGEKETTIEGLILLATIDSVDNKWKVQVMSYQPGFDIAERDYTRTVAIGTGGIIRSDGNVINSGVPTYELLFDYPPSADATATGTSLMTTSMNGNGFLVLSVTVNSAGKGVPIELVNVLRSWKFDKVVTPKFEDCTQVKFRTVDFCLPVSWKHDEMVKAGSNNFAEKFWFLGPKGNVESLLTQRYIEGVTLDHAVGLFENEMATQGFTYTKILSQENGNFYTATKGPIKFIGRTYQWSQGGNVSILTMFSPAIETNPLSWMRSERQFYLLKNSANKTY